MKRHHMGSDWRTGDALMVTNVPLVFIHGVNMRLLYASRNSDDLGFKLSCEIIEDKFKCDFI